MFTETQKQATINNFKIIRMRGVRTHVDNIVTDEVLKARMLQDIDTVLADLGASNNPERYFSKPTEK